MTTSGEIEKCPSLIPYANYWDVPESELTLSTDALAFIAHIHTGKVQKRQKSVRLCKAFDLIQPKRTSSLDVPPKGLIISKNLT